MGHECCGGHGHQHKHSHLKPKQPSKAPEIRKKDSDVISTFKVSGMDCSDEVSAIQNAFKIELVSGVEANIMKESVTVYHDPKLPAEKIRAIIEKTGLKVVNAPQSFFQDHSKRIALVSTSGISLGLGLIFGWQELFPPFIVNSLYFISILSAGGIIFPKSLRAMKQFHLDMNVLMTVAVVGAIFIKEYSEAASVVFLFSLAELLEAMSVSRARKAIQEVLKVAPKEAIRVLADGKTEAISAEALNRDDVILVKAGENIPVDGQILEGKSSINQASLTGESIPVPKEAGDTVWAGTLNESGILKVRVHETFKDTKIAKVIHMIEEAQNEKAPSQRFVDKFAKIYTPIIMILAVLVAAIPPLILGYDFNEWFYKALVLLVIGCPCALVIATPISVVSGLTSLARRGVLVKGGVHLESLGKLKAMALDKTGTITEGRPEVQDFKIFNTHSEEEVIRLTASLESVSTHPLAKAIMNYAHEKKVSFSHPKDYEMISGKGAQGEIDGHWYFVGNHLMAHELGICTPEIEAYLDTVEARAMSVIVLGHAPHNDCKGEKIAVFAVGDKIRNDVKSAIISLHKAGIKTVAMLSGDNQKTVTAVAKDVGIDYAKGALLPDQKVEEVKGLVKKYEFVGMVGDGVNDAPAMAQATLGIAMGVAGSDTAIETADIALMKDELSELPKAISHGRRVLSVIQFNIYFAILIKAVFFVLAFFGLANLWMAVAADMGASIFVTFNALRLLKVDR